MPTIRHATSRGAGFPRGRHVRRTGRRLPARVGVAVLALVAVMAPLPRPAAAAPHVIAQHALPKVPGEIVAWRDSTWYAVGRDSTGTTRFVRGTRHGGAGWSCALGPAGGGEFAGLSPDCGKLLVTAPDSLGRRFLYLGTLPAGGARRGAAGKPPAAGAAPTPPAGETVRWKALTPVTDADPHVSWFADGSAFLYQDLLDDALEVPSIFAFKLAGDRPRLFVRGAQKPLLAPTADAVAFVGVDTTRKVVAKDVESYSPVGLDDMAAGDFRWVAPLRSWVPDRDAWSPDGQRVAFLAYGADSAGTPTRALHVYSRPGQATRSLPLVGDSGRPDRDHASDVAAWSPDSRWIAVARAFGRGAATEDQGWVWLVSPGGYDAARISPPEGSWRGAPLWIDRRTFVIADGAGAGTGRGYRKYWVVEIGD